MGFIRQSQYAQRAAHGDVSLVYLRQGIKACEECDDPYKRLDELRRREEIEQIQRKISSKPKLYQ